MMVPNMIDVGEEKKDDMPSKMEEKLSGREVSRRRAKAAGSAGLSELSKQLRVFQAKNEAQAVEINRLERQLRILADLQGISVADLRKALEDACANEAFGEMQHRVAKLRAELEAATLAKQSELRKDMAAPEIANLELRVGELEEVEEKQEREIHHLYEQLRHERAARTRLEAENDQLRKDANDYYERVKQEAARAAQVEANYQEQLRKLLEEQAQKYQERMRENNQNGSLSSVPPEMAADYERLLQAMKEKDDALLKAQTELKAEQEKSMQRMRDLDQVARQTEVDNKVDYEEMRLLIKQLQDADSQNELRLAQYKTRFAVQDERIKDMAQQLESLYAAFGLLKEEQDAESMRRSTLENNLDEADAAIARQMDSKQKKKIQQRNSPNRNSANQQVSSSPTPNTPSSQGSAAAAYAPATTPPTARAVGSPFQPVLDAPPQEQSRTASTWQLIKGRSTAAPTQTFFSEDPLADTGLLISGVLIAKSNSMVRKWKNKNSKIFLQGDHYQWNLGDTKSFPLLFGVSKVEFNPNHPLSFVVYINPQNPHAPVIQAATSCEEDYNLWMSALTKATSGGEYRPTDTPARRTSETPDNSAIVNRSSVADVQEASDFELAMELSREQT